MPASSLSGYDPVVTETYKLLPADTHLMDNIINYFGLCITQKAILQDWFKLKLGPVPKKAKQMIMDNLHPIFVMAP